MEYKKEVRSKIEILLITMAVFFVVTMLIIPLLSVLVNSLRNGWNFYWQSLTTPYVLSALKLTIIATVVAVLVNTGFGLSAAWAVTKFEFPGKQLLTTLIDIPFSISPVIAGLAFIMTFGRMGWAGQWIEALNDYWGTDKLYLLCQAYCWRRFLLPFPSSFEKSFLY